MLQAKFGDSVATSITYNFKNHTITKKTLKFFQRIHKQLN